VTDEEQSERTGTGIEFPLDGSWERSSMRQKRIAIESMVYRANAVAAPLLYFASESGAGRKRAICPSQGTLC